MALYNQVIYRRFSVPESQFKKQPYPRMAKSWQTTYRDWPNPGR
jgi:hypothetical protein